MRFTHPDHALKEIGNMAEFHEGNDKVRCRIRDIE